MTNVSIHPRDAIEVHASGEYGVERVVLGVRARVYLDARTGAVVGETDVTTQTTLTAPVALHLGRAEAERVIEQLREALATLDRTAAPAEPEAAAPEYAGVGHG